MANNNSNVGIQINLLFQGLQQQIDELKKSISLFDVNEAAAAKEKVAKLFNTVQLLQKEVIDDRKLQKQCFITMEQNLKLYMVGQMEQLEQRFFAMRNEIEQNVRKQIQETVDSKLETIGKKIHNISSSLAAEQEFLHELDTKLEQSCYEIREMSVRTENYGEKQGKINDKTEKLLGHLSKNVISEIYNKMEADVNSTSIVLKREEARTNQLQSALEELTRANRRLTKDIARAEETSSNFSVELDASVVGIQSQIKTLHDQIHHFAATQKSNERSNEALKNWVSTEIRKGQEQQQTDSGIGVRCLVCNHPTTMREQQVIVPSTDQFKTTVQVQHRQTNERTHAQDDSGLNYSTSPSLSGTRRKLASLFGPHNDLLPCDIGAQSYAQKEALLNSTATEPKIYRSPIVSRLPQSVNTVNYPYPSSEKKSEDRQYFQNLASKFPSSPDRGQRPVSANAAGGNRNRQK